MFWSLKARVSLSNSCMWLEDQSCSAKYITLENYFDAHRTTFSRIARANATESAIVELNLGRWPADVFFPRQSDGRDDARANDDCGREPVRHSPICFKSVRALHLYGEYRRRKGESALFLKVWEGRGRSRNPKLGFVPRIRVIYPEEIFFFTDMSGFLCKASRPSRAPWLPWRNNAYRLNRRCHRHSCGGEKERAVYRP